MKVILFDIFGTVVDWRGSIVREGTTWGHSRGIPVDWGRFADRWRQGYVPIMDRVRKGSLPWLRLHRLHRLLLDDLLVEFNISGLTEAEKEHWTSVWQRLHPWPDSVAALHRLKSRYIIGTLSNGNVSLLLEMAKSAGLPWDVILSAELFHHFKPDPEVYLGAADMLGCHPSEIMLVAAHTGDLRAAQACGFKTGFVHRPLENGPSGPIDRGDGMPFDAEGYDLLALAAKLA